MATVSGNKLAYVGTDPTPRLKDMSKQSLNYYNTLSANARGFVDEYYALTGRTFEITSGKREKTKKFSHHHTGDALDIKASHTQDYDFLVNTKEGLQLMNKYGFGIIDETDPVMMKQTGATGPHFHLGKDSKYVKRVNDRLANFDNEGKIYSYQEWIQGGRNPQDFLAWNAEQRNDSEYVKDVEKYVPLEEHLHVEAETRAMEKEVVKQVNMDDDRKALLEATNAENEKRRGILQDYITSISSLDTDPLKKYEQATPEQQLPQLQPLQLQDYNLNLFQ